MNCRCGASLNTDSAVQREYIDKGDKPNMVSFGHYDENGNFEPDQKVDLSGGNYDTFDGCDTCTDCGNIVG